MLPKTHSSQRALHYQDVDDLVSPGFLSHSLTIAGVSIALRTLGPGDLFLLRHRTGGDMTDWQLWAVASSIWMVNGHNLLEQSHLTPRIFKMLGRLPVRAQIILFSTFTGLLSRQHKAEEAIEPFMYEMVSRGRWRALGGDVSRLTQGVPGASRLGMNTIQSIWTVFNEAEDRKLAFNNQWEGFKLVASSNSPKGVKKIDEKDSRQMREEEGRRQSVMDRYYYYRRGVIDREGFMKNRDRDLIGSRVTGPKTVEQLEVEMKRWVAGEYDEHDQIVEGYKQRILDRQAEQERERAKRRDRLRAESEKRQEAAFEPTSMIGYSQEQLAQILARREGGMIRPGARFVYDDQVEQARAKTDRHIRPASAGRLEVRQGRIVDPQANPSADHRTLQQLIQGRQVEVNDGPQEPSPQSTAGKMPPGVSQSDWDEYGGKMDSSVFGGQVKGVD